jgi:hypothetical protein
MTWPENKEFAFTIVDDTDFATVPVIKPVYDYLLKHKIITSKTVWVFPSRDRFTGDCLLDEKYYQFILDLKSHGVEICIHGIGSGDFTRDEIKEGLEIFKNKLGYYPNLNTNHAINPYNMYWGNSSYHYILRLYSFLRRSNEYFYGEKTGSKYFWGDIFKEKIKYIRGKICDDINTLHFDPQMPYIDKNKKYCNFWFSSSDGRDIDTFNKLVSKENINKLKNENGLCIVYTHFARDFVKDGILNESFMKNISYLAQQNGWFAPASQILNYMLDSKKNMYVSNLYLMKYEINTIFERIKKKFANNK